MTDKTFCVPRLQRLTGIREDKPCMNSLGGPLAGDWLRCRQSAHVGKVICFVESKEGASGDVWISDIALFT